MVMVAIISALNKLPLQGTTENITAKVRTDKSAKGSVVFPGSINAKSKVIGIMSNPVAITNGCPVATAASSPMYISLPGNLLFRNYCVASEMTIKPSINNEIILGISKSTAATFIPTIKICWIVVITFTSGAEN